MFKKINLSLFFVLSLLFSFGQIEDPSEKVIWEISYEQVDCEVTLIAKITMDDHWHISAANLPLDCFSIPTSINIDDNPDYDVEDSIYEKSTKEATSLFIRFLEKHNILVKLRRSRGEDIAAACGQLAIQNK